MDYSKVRIIDFLELYSEIENKKDIKICVIYNDNEIEFNLEDFRQKLNGLEYHYCEQITMIDNFITIVI